MSEITTELLLNALRNVKDTDTGVDVVSAGLISGIVLQPGKAGFLITIAPQDKHRKAYLREACEKAVLALDGIHSVTAVLTAQTSADAAMNSHQQQHTAAGGDRARAQWNLTPLPGVSRVIAVASGKGGVGKSTTAVNIARAVAASGHSAALLDADIYGPSLPHMTGLSGQPTVKDGLMQPLMSGQIACMSMGFITGDEAAILRGPMITKTLQQMLRMSAWGTRDLLVVDMPPGTGDVHISMVQQVPLSGAVIVTTPQEVALIDARKCAQMFMKVGVPILGVIENMSYLPLPGNDQKQYIFGKGGGKKLALELGVPLLAEIPILQALGEAADNGLSALNAGTPQAEIFAAIAEKLLSCTA